jgi:hypothetical protein
MRSLEGYEAFGAIRAEEETGGFSMKLATAMFTAALALAPAVGLAQVLPPNNPNSTTFTLPLTVSPGAATCLPNAKGASIIPSGTSSISKSSLADYLRTLTSSCS